MSKLEETVPCGSEAGKDPALEGCAYNRDVRKIGYEINTRCEETSNTKDLGGEE